MRAKVSSKELRKQQLEARKKTMLEAPMPVGKKIKKALKILGCLLLSSSANATEFNAAYWQTFSSKAIMEFQQALTQAGKFGVPRYTTALLPTCNAANTGAVAWDTTSTSLKACNGGSWVASGGGGGLADPGSNGMLARTAVDVTVARTITAGTGIGVTNGDGVAGNPTASVDTATTPQFSSGTASVPATGAVGTFYFETDRPAAYTYPNTDAETVLLSLPAGTGTSGGILYFTATADVVASSAALTANLPVIGGGAGTAPTVGTRSGNTTAYVTTTGTQTSGDCVKIDANGNHIANGSACGGSFDPATTLDLLEEFGTGSTVSGEIGTHGLVIGFISTGTYTSNITETSMTRHPGLGRLLSHATNDNSGLSLYWSTDAGASALSLPWYDNDWALDGIFLPGSNSTAITSTAILFGLANGQADPSANARGIFIRRDTDLSETTVYTFVTCDASGAAGCNSADDDTDANIHVSTITPVAGTWNRFRIRRAAVGVGGIATIYFRVNDETEVTFCASGCDESDADAPIVSSGTLSFQMTYLTRTTTGVLSGDIDMMRMSVTFGAARY